ncbi:MAG: hypothetical protein Q4P06_08065 [Actinomycetaceae bacterium]|nr:hypothetical protein [Actinomycetaceae bacterium]
MVGALVAASSCRFWEIGCKAKETVAEAAAGAVQDLGNAISSALARALTELSTFWVDIPTVDISVADGARAFIQGSTAWMTVALVMLSIMIAGFKIILERRGEPGVELVKSLLTVVVVAGVSVTGIQLLVDISDEFSVWVLQRASVESDLVLLLNPTGLASGVNAGMYPVAIMIVGGIVGIIASIIQMGLMLLRGVMLIILTGILPLAAAMTNSAWGKEWLTKTVGWLIAFLLYKPAAAIIYATAIMLLDSGGGFVSVEGIIRFAMALMTIGMGILALPSLIKFIMPATAALSSGGGGGGMMGMAAMMGASHMMSSSQSAPSGAVAADSAASSSMGAASGASSAGAGASASAGAAAAAGPAAPLVIAGMEGAKAVKGAAEDATETATSSAGSSAPSGSAPSHSGGDSPAEGGPSGAGEARDE